MIRLVLPVPKSTENMLEKARPGLIFRTDLPYHTAKGELKYRKGWVKPEDAKALDQAKKQHNPSAVIGKYQYEPDMFDDSEGEAWESAEAKMPEPAPVEEKKPEPWMVSTEPEKSKGHIGFFGAGDRKRELLAYGNGEIYTANLDDVIDVNTGNRIGRWEGPAWQKDDIMARLGIVPEKAAPKAPLYIEDLTERAIIVRGDTRTHKEKIKEAGGKWNGKHGGWIFPKKWEEKVRGQLGALLESRKPEEKEQKPKPQQGGDIDNIAMKNGWDTWVSQPLEVLQETKEKYQGRKDYGEFMAFLEKLIADKAQNAQGGATIDSTEKPDKLHGNDTDRAIASRGGQVVDEKKPQPSRVADRIAKPEIADGEEAKTGDVQADLEKPISKMKFRDYGSWNASGKHLSPTKRAALNQQIAELLLLPSDEIEPKELALIRQYSGFGGTKVEDERGVLYDYFTSPPVARMVWKLANKIVPLKSGMRALEPSCGGGVFFDVAPQGVDLTGVEYDSRTAAVASLLQPQARIYHSSFEQFNLHQREKFDVVVGNAPFGNRSVDTSFLDDPDEKSLDRYFISRSLDNLKGGAPMALIVGPGVMDNVTSKEWRAKMLRKGQFIGAMRLPNQSFKHTQTGVSPDIIMFRAYPKDIRSKLNLMSDEEIKAAGFWDEAWVNGTYYDEMPAHRLGRVERGNFDSEITVGKLDPEDMDHALGGFKPREAKTIEEFAVIREKALQGQQTGFFADPGESKNIEKLSEQEAAAVANKTLRVGMTKTVDGKIYRLNANHRWELVDGANETQAIKMDRVKEISETVLAIREAMRNDAPVDNLQRQARSLLEAYAKDFGVKHSEDKDIQRFIKANPSVSGVHEAITVELESDLLTKQNVYSKEIEIVDGHRPAIKALLDLGHVLIPGTVEAIKARFPNDAEGLIEAMWEDPDVFIDENGVFILREDFISGNAWDKIDAMEKAVQDHPGDEWARNRDKWQAGANALRDAVGWIPIEDADVFPQASWIPEEIVNDWAEKGMEHEAPRGYRYARNEEGKWGLIAEYDIQGRYSWKKRDYDFTEEGEWKEHADELVYFLNNQKQRSKYTDTETYNKNAVENFKTWLATNEAERKEVEEIYNRQFNTELGVPTKTYSVNLDGWNSEIEIKPWQWQSIHHLYRQGKGISALGTGFGKTYAAIALYALLRQEGKIKRALFQVPNNKVKDWVKYFGKALPGIKVGSVDPEADGYGNMAKRFGWYQSLASGDYDVIILPETSASEIQLNDENDGAIVKDISSQIVGKKKTERQEENAKATAEGKLSGGKKNLTITFEELGCDSIFADECFPYGAKVKTRNGDIPIGEIVERGLDVEVLSCDTETGRLEYKPVVRRIPRTLNHKVLKINYQGGFLVCTDSHKVWTVENGYQRADEIKNGTTLRILREPDERGSNETEILFTGMCEQSENRFWKADRKALRDMWGAVQLQVFRTKEQLKASVLFRTLRGGLQEQSTPCEGTDREKNVSSLGSIQGQRLADGANARVYFSPNEGSQPHEAARDSRKSQNGEQGPNISIERRKRTANKSPGYAFACDEYAHRISDQNKTRDGAIPFAPPMLQGRFGDTRAKNSDRSGRTNSQNAQVEVSRCTKNGSLECARVESIEVLERRDFDRYGFRDSQDSTVYDIEVEGNHNFFADGVLVSNCHRMKNLFTSSLSRETGMNDGRRSDRALSFFKKCEYIRRQHEGKNVFGLTATPLTNSPLEYYNMMQHIAPEELARKGISNIDNFIQNFADIKDGQKYDSFSGQLKPGKVLVGFKNLRSLQDMFFKYTDLQNDPTKIGLKKPTPTNKPNILPKQDDQTQEVQSIAARVEAYRKMTKEERQGLGENFLTYYSQMRTASLDLELYDPVKYKGWKNPKIEKMADSAWETYNARGGGQVVFCDRVLSGDGSMNMHEKIKKSLVARGFKESEIVVVNGLTKSGTLASDQALEKMVSDAIDGFNGKWENGKLVVPPKYKIIIGTTQTIGEGVNLQKNSSALHHMDIPYRPSDFIQRNGRVDRQGNKQDNVELHTYATAGTIDNYSMALVAGKENWINQLLRTKSNVFTNPNGDGIDMDEILLSLTEEWGDKATADEKRKAIADKKATAIKTENQKKAHDYLKQLSLMRGALSTYNGDKGSREYQNRLRKIDNIEAGLSNNPEFRNPEILGETPPEFIYDEGRQKVIFKGDLVIRDGHISRVSGFNYKKREYNLRSVIAGEKETAVPAYASSHIARWSGGNQDKTIIITNPTPAEVERYIAMADYKGFYGKPLEFKRDNYEDFVKIHGSRYNPEAMYLFEEKDGTISTSRGSSYFEHEMFNPYSDTGRKKIRAALKSGKMSPSDYLTFEQHFGDLGSKDILRTAAIKRFNQEIHAKPIMAALSAQKPDSQGRIDMDVIVDALRDKQIDEYSIKRTLRMHPDFDVDYDYIGEGEERRFTTVVTRKEGVEKSLGYSNMIAKGGRVYVLLPGRR